MTAEKSFMTPDALRSAPAIRLGNEYRIGDAVAVMLLRKYIDQHFGKKEWYLAKPNAVLSLLSARLPDEDWDWKTSSTSSAIANFDEVNLWLWNDVWYREGFRLDLTPHPSPMQFDVLFAPLLEVDYSMARAMHSLFVLGAIRALKELTEEAGLTLGVLLPPTVGYHDFSRLSLTGATLIRTDLSSSVDMVGHCRVFVGGDTGLSHVCGCYPHVKQVALHDRSNTEHHNEREFDHQKTSREVIATYTGVEAQYRSTPNKREGCAEIYFDHGGMDAHTLEQMMEAVKNHLGLTLS